MGTINKISVTLEELREIGLDEEQINALIVIDKKRDEIEAQDQNEEQAELDAAETFANGGAE